MIVDKQNKGLDKQQPLEEEKEYLDNSNHIYTPFKQQKQDEEETYKPFGGEQSWENIKTTKSKVIADGRNKCDECGKGFITPKGMKEHVSATHSGGRLEMNTSKNEEYLGEEDEEGLTNIIEEGAKKISEAPGTADNNSGKQTDVEKFECRFCEKKFTKSSKMRNHMRRSHRVVCDIRSTHSGKRLDKLQKRARKELLEYDDDLRDADNHRRGEMKIKRIKQKDIDNSNHAYTPSKQQSGVGDVEEELTELDKILKTIMDLRKE